METENSTNGEEQTASWDSNVFESKISPELLEKSLQNDSNEQNGINVLSSTNEFANQNKDDSFYSSVEEAKITLDRVEENDVKENGLGEDSLVSEKEEDKESNKGSNADESVNADPEKSGEEISDEDEEPQDSNEVKKKSQSVTELSSLVNGKADDKDSKESAVESEVSPNDLDRGGGDVDSSLTSTKESTKQINDEDEDPSSKLKSKHDDGYKSEDSDETSSKSSSSNKRATSNESCAAEESPPKRSLRSPKKSKEVDPGKESDVGTKSRKSPRSTTSKRSNIKNQNSNSEESNSPSKRSKVQGEEDCSENELESPRKGLKRKFRSSNSESCSLSGSDTSIQVLSQEEAEKMSPVVNLGHKVEDSSSWRKHSPKNLGKPQIENKLKVDDFNDEIHADKTVINLKKHVARAGLKIENYNTFWANCKSKRAKIQKLKDFLREKGVEASDEEDNVPEKVEIDSSIISKEDQEGFVKIEVLRGKTHSEIHIALVDACGKSALPTSAISGLARSVKKGRKWN